MGNICRSPLAEGVFLHKARQRGVSDRFLIDSAGTGGWHAGQPADPRMHRLAQDRGVQLPSVARRVTRADFAAFDLLICMDEDNREDLLRLGAPEERVKLLLEFDPDAPVHEVPDPYYGGTDGFSLVYRLVDAACERLLDQLLAGDVPSVPRAEER
jgi:protein-tyrosine phosphatase